MQFVIYTCAMVILFCVIMLVKNFVTYEQHAIIGDAIYKYRMDCIGNYDYDYKVDYGDMEDYDSTMWRLWDWGYTRILPKEKYAIIEKYINI